MAEFEERFDCEEDVKVDSSDNVSEVRMRFPGVTKAGNRWRARIQHPKLKFGVSLGSYATHEEAVLVVKKKRAEFEEMFKGENSMNEETCWDDFEGRKLPVGVSRRGYEKWGAQAWNPRLKRYVRLGSYSSPEKAAFVVKKKRAEFVRLNGMSSKVMLGYKDNDKFSEKIDIMSEILDKPTNNLMLPKGVRKLQSGKWCARITDPISRARIWLGRFNTAEDAVSSLNQSKAELDDKRNKEEFEEDVKIDTCDDVSEVKRFPGVTKRGNRWRARIQHRMLNCDVSLGSYTTHEEAVHVVKKKKAEFEEMFKGENSMNVQTLRDNFEGGELPHGVSRMGYGRRGTQILDPKLKARYTNMAPQALNQSKAELADKRNKEEFEEDVKIDTYDDVSEVKRFPGVTKRGNRWRARIQNRMLNFDVSLGSYTTHEEAVYVVKKRKAEFEEMFKGENSMNVETCKDNFEGGEFPHGVSSMGYGSQGTQIWHPKLKHHDGLGSYSAHEATTSVVDKRRAEFLKMYGWSPKFKPDSKKSDGNEFVSKKPKRDISDELTSDQELPSGVKKLKSGKWGAGIRDPKTKTRTLLGRFDTVHEAIKALNKGKSELAAKRIRDEFYGIEFRPKARPCFDASDGSIEVERTSDLNDIASHHDIDKPKRDISDNLSGELELPSGVRKLKSWKWGARIRNPKSRARIRLGTSGIGKESVKSLNKVKAALATERKRAEYDGLEFLPQSRPVFEANEGSTKIERADILHNASLLDKLKSMPTSIYVPENLNWADVGDTSVNRKEKGAHKSGCVDDFEKAMRMGFINEYGQLLGEFSELDDQMGFSLPEDCD